MSFDRKAYNKQYYQDNREEILAQKKQYNDDRKEEKAEYDSEHYQRNKILYVARHASVSSYLRSECLICGSEEQLHLHHIDPTTKEANVGNLVTHLSIAPSMERVEGVIKEAVLCVVLCNSCHGKVHHGTLELSAEDTCSPSGYSVSGLLEHIRRSGISFGELTA